MITKQRVHGFAAMMFAAVLLSCSSDGSGGSGGGSGTSITGGPVLFFSDLTWGPKTGWENSTTKGAAVTVWGKNFGASRGSNTVNVGSVTLTSDSDYAEWGVVGPARDLQRITFWLNSSMSDGPVTIAVTVNGTASNTLPFTIASGTIYFVAGNDGNNSFNGKFSTRNGHTGDDGPFQDLFMFNPGLDSYHNTSNRNPSGDGQYLVYVRSGDNAYTNQDVDEAMIAMRGPYGGTDKQKALIGYPGETPVIDTSTASRGIIWNSSDSGYGFNDDITVAKLHGKGGTAPISIEGDRGRVVGCTFQDYLDNAWTGVVWVSRAKYASIFGNLFDHDGYDSYKHNIYVKTQSAAFTLPAGRDLSTQHIDIGWNEFKDATSGTDRRGGVIFVSKSSEASVASQPTNDIRIHGNLFRDGDMDFIYIGDGVTIGDIFIYDNVLTGGTSTNGGMTFQNGTSDIFLYNNTFYQIGPAAEAMAWATGEAQIHSANNIWYPSPNQRVFYLETYQGARFTSVNDLFYPASGATLPESDDGYAISGTVIGDPLFVNTSAYDFHLQDSSPARNAGSSDVGTVVTQDYDGKSRPYGSGYDIGAFENITAQ